MVYKDTEADLREYYDAEYKDVFAMPALDDLNAATVNEIKNSYGFARWRFRKACRELWATINPFKKYENN